MRKILFIILTLFLAIIAYYLFTKEIKDGVTTMDKYTRINVDSLVKTEFVWKDSKEMSILVYIAHTGSCFIRKTPTARWRIAVLYKSRTFKTPTLCWRINETACFRNRELFQR